MSSKNVKKKWQRAEQRNDEHDLVVGKRYRFKHLLTKSNETGTLLYLFTRRVYKHDDDGNIDVTSWKVGHFRCGYVPDNGQADVHSIHLGCGAFTIHNE